MVHIPDGYLSTPVWVTTDLIAIVGVGITLREVNKELDERRIPAMGITAAFVFAAQMINFPIAGGTSGHILGGLLTALLLGPLAGVIVMSVVLIVQALVFGDGGISALGANIINMAFIGALVSYWAYRGLRALFKHELTAIAIAGWLSVVLGAIACALEIALSGTVPLRLALPAMAGIHAIIGIGEALVTVAAIAFVKRVRPEVLPSG